LCLKNQNERPSAKELLCNKWLNDDLSEENDKCVLIKDLLRLDVFKVDSNKNNLNSFSPKHLNNTKKIKEDFKYSPKIFRVQSYDHKEKKVFIRRNSSKKLVKILELVVHLIQIVIYLIFKKNILYLKSQLMNMKIIKKKILMKLKYNLL
jgi:hypothetical protein